MNVCVGVGPPANVAVYVVLLTGVVMSWIARAAVGPGLEDVAPWGEGASMLRMMPSTPTTVDGAVNGCPSSFNWSPAGLVVNVIVVVRGTTSRKLSDVRPAESMTERWIRYQTLGDVSPTRRDDERSAGRPAGRGKNRMGVRVVMEIHPPRQRVGGQAAVLGVASRARVVDGRSAGVRGSGGAGELIVAVGVWLVVTVSDRLGAGGAARAVRHDAAVLIAARRRE